MEIEVVKQAISDLLDGKSIEEKINVINEMREHIHILSPFKDEPTDFVKWIKLDDVIANEYNPNRVAPPEMKLLEVSIINDGYTQPIVTFSHDNIYEVVDGFHRNRVGRESEIVKKRIYGYLPTVEIRKEQSSKSDRIAATIRHNRARGKHVVDAMSEIVLELKNRNWKNDRISRELGMDEDEILRLCQITGLEGLFKDDDFSRSWNIEDSSEEDFSEINDNIDEEEKQINNFRSINTDDEERIFHTYEKWECYKAGFYATSKKGMSSEQCELEYAKLLSNEKEFSETLEKIISEWKHSCEHYLTNKSMNRIAWLGQAALCYAKGIPSTFRGGFHLLSASQQIKANRVALSYLNKWLKNNGIAEIDLKEAADPNRQVDIY